MNAATGAPHHRIITLAVMRQPELVAENSIRLWQDLSSELISLIGEGGFQSLYERSLNISSASFPSKVSVPPSVADSRFASLQALLESQPQAEAARTSIALLTVFVDILTLLIGEHLTTNLLRAAWGDEPIESAAKGASE